LDEAQDMPLETQIILLRVLEEYKYESLGSNKSKVADIRLITAISQNPEQLVEKGTFRKDLYFRLNTGILRIPPLRERKEDIPLLLNYYMNKFHCNKIIEDKAMDILMNYRWPGNVRQLVQVVQAFNVFVAGDTISEKFKYIKKYWFFEFTPIHSNIGKTKNYGSLKTCQG
jgi:transcriptional regulator with PAS, ATPase and Fis domain